MLFDRMFTYSRSHCGRASPSSSAPATFVNCLFLSHTKRGYCPFRRIAESSSVLCGGGRRIRTYGRSLVNGFQDVTKWIQSTLVLVKNSVSTPFFVVPLGNTKPLNECERGSRGAQVAHKKGSRSSPFSLVVLSSNREPRGPTLSALLGCIVQQ